MARLKWAAIWLLCLVAAVVCIIWMGLAIIVGSFGRSFNIALGLDEAANAALGGVTGESISSRAAKAREQGRRWGCLLCKLLDAIQKDHCANSIIPDRGDPA